MPYRYVCNHWWSKSISYMKVEFASCVEDMLTSAKGKIDTDKLNKI